MRSNSRNAYSELSGRNRARRRFGSWPCPFGPTHSYVNEIFLLGAAGGTTAAACRSPFLSCRLSLNYHERRIGVLAKKKFFPSPFCRAAGREPAPDHLAAAFFLKPNSKASTSSTESCILMDREVQSFARKIIPAGFDCRRRQHCPAWLSSHACIYSPPTIQSDRPPRPVGNGRRVMGRGPIFKS